MTMGAPGPRTGKAGCGSTPRLGPESGLELLQQDLSATGSLDLTVQANGFSHSRNVEDQLIHLARDALDELRLRHAVQLEYNILDAGDRSLVCHESQAILFRRVDLCCQVNGEGMVAPGADNICRPDLRSCVPVSRRRCGRVEDRYAAKDRRACAPGRHNPQLIHDDWIDGMYALVADGRALAQRVPGAARVPFNAEMPHAFAL